MEKNKIMGEKVFDKYKWYKHYNFKANFGKYFSLVEGENYADFIKYYKGNDVNRVIDDAKKIMQKSGWNYVEILDKSNEEICLINKDGFLKAYQQGEKLWKLKTDVGYLSEYQIGGL